MLMMQYGIYSVISPDGCASILCKSAEIAPEAAEAMQITAKQIHEMGIIDQVIEEPLGGAHRDEKAIASKLKSILIDNLNQLKQQSTQDLLEQRYNKLMAIGACE
jgi:acetyl-CoA carboxylase carboxyl transferase subunit alpha